MNNSFFPQHSPWGQAETQKPFVIPDKPDTHNLPVGRARSDDKDLENAHHLLNAILINLDPERDLPRNRVSELQADLREIEQLLYRNLR